MSRAPLVLAAAMAVCALWSSGCRDVRGRKRLREAGELYNQGRYREAVATFEQAERLVPELPVLWLNKGYTCRQLVVPGARTEESRRAASCAAQAFLRLQALDPRDPRGQQLYLQTLYDADDFPTLEKVFQDRLARQPDDLEALHGLGQVTFKMGRWPDALKWTRRAAEVRSSDAEAQYAVGTLVWRVLSARGGGPEMAAFDPRPRLEDAVAGARGRRGKGMTSTVQPPATSPMDLTGAVRVELADLGLSYLRKALDLRPAYPDAMTYIGLVHRQKSFAFFADVARWQQEVEESKMWHAKALAASASKAPDHHIDAAPGPR